MINQDLKIQSYLLTDDGTWPNNSTLPLLYYPGAFTWSEREDPAEVEQVFHGNHWINSWRNGIYSFHHYHSTAHEVLGIYGGTVTVQLGGPDGVILDAQSGDVIVIPAGVAHKNHGSSRDFRCIGAYPDGQTWDMNYGKPGERPAADENIARLKLPSRDPIFGNHGPVGEFWKT